MKPYLLDLHAYEPSNLQQRCSCQWHRKIGPYHIPPQKYVVPSFQPSMHLLPLYRYASFVYASMMFQNLDGS